MLAPIPPAPAPVQATTQETSASVFLTKVAAWDGTSQDIEQTLTAAFDAKDYLDCIRDLRGRNIDPLSYIDSLDKVSLDPIQRQHVRFMTIWQQIIDSLPADSELRKRCLRALRKTCGICEMLPTSHEVPFMLKNPDRQRPLVQGGFSDVWKLSDERDQDQVFAVKKLRVYGEDKKINKVEEFIVVDPVQN